MHKVKLPDTQVHPRVLTFYTFKQMLGLKVYLGNGRDWFEAGPIETVAGNPVENWLIIRTEPIQVDRNMGIVHVAIIDFWAVRCFYPLVFPQALPVSSGEFFVANLAIEGVWENGQSEAAHY